MDEGQSSERDPIVFPTTTLSSHAPIPQTTLIAFSEIMGSKGIRDSTA